MAKVVEKLCSGALWSEGPVWIAAQQCVLWSDIPNNRMLRWSASQGMTVWRDNVEFTNGHTLDLNGDLLHCSHGLRAIVRTPLVGGQLRADTPDVMVINRYQGKRLNSPNDIVVKSDGTIWFTDPPYGILSNAEGHKGTREQSCNFVFCYDPKTLLLHAVSHFLEEPNGLAFSPDETILYVSDTSAATRTDGSGNHHIVAFDVQADCTSAYTLKNPRIFATIETGLPDGFRVDTDGQIYTSSLHGVQIYGSQGKLVNTILVPEKVGNLCFGGSQGRDLFITASTSLYRYG
jgi:gluconolactonase